MKHFSKFEDKLRNHLQHHKHAACGHLLTKEISWTNFISKLTI